MTRRAVVLAQSEFGGRLILDLSPVHSYRCSLRKSPWLAERGTACVCGASGLVADRDTLVAAVAALTNREVRT